jgi:hypothetical protein
MRKTNNVPKEEYAMWTISNAVPYTDKAADLLIGVLEEYFKQKSLKETK